MIRNDLNTFECCLRMKDPEYKTEPRELFRMSGPCWLCWGLCSRTVAMLWHHVHEGWNCCHCYPFDSGRFFFNHVFKRIIICTILDACHHAIPWHFSYFLDNNKPFLLDMTFSITILDNHWSDLSDLSLSSRFVAPGANKLSLAESESLGIWGRFSAFSVSENGTSSAHLWR